ncbi:33435_t:CDS:2 [Racocetra persica]|uniref:33435_t:CDS:1 n=1 Tax=Racocetra persica TaxID=160502 RepID=A0ACA9PLR4_9GLOM|nr:33435_t:CDS:2 [Racocetra persica]
MNDPNEKITSAKLIEDQEQLKAKYEAEINTIQQENLSLQNTILKKDNEIFDLQKTNKNLSQDRDEIEQAKKTTKEQNDFLTEFNKLQEAKQMKGENLKQKTVQETPIKLIYSQNDFAVFDKGSSEFYGAEDEFISDQPLENLGIIMDDVFNTIFHKKKMKQALQSPSHQAALVDRLIDSMKTKATTTLNKKLVEIICTKENYKDTAWQEISQADATIDSLDKAIKILKLLKQAYNGMDEISSDYNKGYQKPGDPT